MSQPDYPAQVAVRDLVVLDAALDEAIAVGLNKLTRENIAKRAGVSTGTVSHCAPMWQLKDAVVKRAVAMEILSIVAQAIVDGHPAARLAPDELRARALASMLAES